MDTEEKVVDEKTDEEKQEEYEKGILGAVDEAIVNADVKLSAKPVVDEKPTEENTEETAEENPEEPAEEETAEEEKPVDDEKPTDEEKSDEEEEPSDEEKSGEEEKPAEEAESDEVKKPSDEFGDLPKDTKKETTERFQTLKTKYDEQFDNLERVTKQNSDWMETIKSTGANPEQLGQALSYLEDVNTGTPESLERAYTVMSAELKVLAEALGKEAPGVDPLEAHDDLKKKVDDGYMDREDALELAAARSNARIHEHSESVSRETSANEKAYQDGLEDIRVLGQQLNTANPSVFKAKYPYLKTVIEAVVSSGAPPTSWAKSISKAFNGIEVPTIAPLKKPIKAVNSIRPTGSPGSSGTVKQAGSILEAVDQALGLSS